MSDLSAVMFNFDRKKFTKAEVKEAVAAAGVHKPDHIFCVFPHGPDCSFKKFKKVTECLMTDLPITVFIGFNDGSGSSSDVKEIGFPMVVYDNEVGNNTLKFLRAMKIEVHEMNESMTGYKEASSCQTCLLMREDEENVKPEKHKGKVKKVQSFMK